MLVKYHAAVSTVISGGLYGLTRSWELAAASFAAGILIDADHTLEYMMEYGLPLNLKKFLYRVSKARYKKVIYLLHAWEWIPLYLLAVWLSDFSPWAVGAAIGVTHHMILDQIGNRTSPFSYFILWRFKQGFVHARCFPGMAKYLYREPTIGLDR